VSVLSTLIEEEIDRFQSLGTVILDIDTTPAEKELCWLNRFQTYDKSLPLVLIGLQVPQAVRDRLPLRLGHQQLTSLPFVQKPFRNEELLAAVRRVQEGSVPSEVDDSHRALLEQHQTSRERFKP
jgi:FixJ family two-component response regulator